MSNFNVKFSPSGQNKVVTQSSGTNITLTSTRAIGGRELRELADINMNEQVNGGVLVYDSTTNSFVLHKLASVDTSTANTVVSIADDVIIDCGFF